MSKTHETVRKIDGEYCHCIDIGCDDFDRAEWNRYVVANNLFVRGYEEVEDWFTHTPLGSPLPNWMSRDELPYIGKKNWRRHGGEEGGEYKAIETGEVKTEGVKVDMPLWRGGIIEAKKRETR